MKLLKAIKFLSLILLSLMLISCQFRGLHFNKIDNEFKQQYVLSAKREAIYKHFVSLTSEKIANQYMKNFDSAMTLIYYSYVNKVELSPLLNAAHKAAIAEKDIDTALDKSLKAATSALDPHTAWLNKKELSALNDTVNGEYVGIGTVISEHPLGVVLQRVYEKGPAYKAGLKTGDVITHASEKTLKGKSLTEVSHILRGKKGSFANIKILRQGKVKSFSVRRDKVEIKPVWATLKNKDIIYLRLDSFNADSSHALRKNLEQMRKQGGESLILDLRANPGGLLPESVAVADSFLNKKREIVSAQERKKDAAEKWHSRKKDLSDNMPMIVLIDEYSASASEIVAAALKDNERAVVMGHRSFGKGSIQEVIPISSKGALRLTFALYQSPNGKLIQAAGVTPHIQILTSKKQGERLEDLEGAIVPKNRHIDKPKYTIEGKKCMPYEEDDMILNCALDLLEDGRLGSFKMAK